VRVPVMRGVKVTLMVQLVLAAVLLPQNELFQLGRGQRLLRCQGTLGDGVYRCTQPVRLCRVGIVKCGQNGG